MSAKRTPREARLRESGLRESGAIAFRGGIARRDCPCAPGSAARLHWQRGYDAAKRAAAGMSTVYTPTAEEIQTLHIAFRRAGEITGHGNGPWKLTPNGVKAMQDAVTEFEAFRMRYFVAAIVKTRAAAKKRNVSAEPRECAANGSTGCVYGSYGPRGETQCAYCGQPHPKLRATPPSAQAKGGES